MKRKFSNLLVGCLVLCGVLSVLSAQAQFYGPSEFIKTEINTGNPSFPFPQFLEYKEGKSLAKYNAEGVTHADMEKALCEGYHIMMHRCIYSSESLGGVRYIKFNPPEVLKNNNTFCSEGDGYALLAAAMFADKATFDGLWLWIHDNRLSKVTRYIDGRPLRPDYRYGGGLPGWLNDENTPTGNGFNDSATDGDFDCAMGLLLAYKQWGEFMGIKDFNGNEISYKEEAEKMLSAMVDTMVLNNLNGGFSGYMSGDVGIDGYVKNGNTWGETTRWRVSEQNVKYPWAKSNPEAYGVTGLYPDYVGPAYFNEFAHYLEENGGSEWKIHQFKRAEASSDWLIGEMYRLGGIASAGSCVFNADQTAIESFGLHPNGPSGEDFRFAWRTILNYLWHGNPTTTWNPVTHECDEGGNEFEYKMALRHAEAVKAPKNRDGSLKCSQLGMSPDRACPNWFGIVHVPQCWAPGENGVIHDPMIVNFNIGAAAPAAVAAEDLELVADVFRQAELMWDDANVEAKMSPNPEKGEHDSPYRYEYSTPIYFHGWFRLLGMLVTSGNFHAARDFKKMANMKVYMDVDKTYAYKGDQITYKVDFRNYGALDAENVVIETELDPNYEFVSATNGGKLVGNKIVWNISSVPGFKTGGLDVTRDSFFFTVVVADTLNPRICLTSKISGDNFDEWESNEYPNNATYTMERNCVDILANRTLSIKKTTNRSKMNPNDIVTFTLEFENKSEGEESWLNGGRSNVYLSYGNFLPNLNSSSTEFYQYYRFWHDAAESYINMSDYRVSYFMNDVNKGFYSEDNPNGWIFENNSTGDALKYGYLGYNYSKPIVFSSQNIPPGNDAFGSWNQRLMIRFSDVLTAATPHIFLKLDHDDYIHKGVVGPALIRSILKTSKSANMNDKVLDDWSYDSKLQNRALDGQAERFFPISPGYADVNNLEVPITNYARHICDPDVDNFDRVLVEQWDGYTWRRIQGKGPLPGREAYNVVIVDTIPIEMEWRGFVDSLGLGVEATYSKAESGAGFTGVVKWSVPTMLVGEKDILKYELVAKDLGCPDMEDLMFKNVAWISSETDSPDSSKVDLVLTCAELPPVIDPQTSLFKRANKSGADIGETVSYNITYVNTEGTSVLGDFSSQTDWMKLGSGNIPLNKNGAFSCDPNANGNSNPAPYFFTHKKAYGKNVFLKSNWDLSNASDIYFVFRYKEGTPYKNDFFGVCLKLTPNPMGDGTVLFEVLDGTNVVAKETSNVFYPSNPDGTFSKPIRIYVKVIDDKIYIYLNDEETVLKSYSGLLTDEAGYIGIYSGDYGNQQTMVHFEADVDYAFDITLFDELPSELGNVTNISDNGTYDASANSIEWPMVATTTADALPPGDSIVRTFDAEVLACDKKYINNMALATVYGLDTLKVLNTIECGSSCPIEKVTLTAAASEICKGDSVLLTATAEPAGNYEYEFFLDKVSLGAPSASDELYVKEKGAYTVKVYDAADISCNKESSKVEVTVDSIPPFSLGNDISLCSGGTAWIKTGLPTGYTYEWSNGAAEDSIEVNAAGEYSVKVSSSICEAFDTIQVTVADELKVDLGPDTTICATSLPYILDATAIYDTYEWSDASTASTLEVTQSGEYTVKVTQGSCSGEGKVTVTVSEVEKLKGTFEVTYLVSDTTANGVFANNLTTQDAGVLEKVSGIQYTWMKADGTPLLEEPTPDVPAAGSSATETYKVFGVNADGCPTDTATINVTISGAPVPVVSDTSYCVGETSQALTATPSPSSDGATWTLQWYDANKSPLAATPTPSTAASGETTYYVSQKSGNNESGLVPVTVKVYGAVTPDVSQNQLAYCMGDTYNNPIATVTANANTLQMQGTLEWKVGATAWDGASPVDYTAGDTKVSVVNKYEISASHVCVSDTASFTVSVTELAKPTGDLSVNYVKTEGASGTFPSLTDKNANVAVPSTGNQLVWYDAAGTKQTDTPTPQYDNNWAAGKDYELTYFVSQTDGTCESDTVAVKVTISDSPMPTAAPVSYCQNSPATALTASINTTVDGAEKYVLLWYTTATGGTAQDSIVPTTDQVGSTTYYVSQKHKDTNAESSRTSVVVTVHALPELGATTPAAQCGGSVDLSTLFNEKNNLSVKYDFYEDATTTTALSSSAVTVGKTYYAEGYYEINATATTTAVCRSVARTPVTVTIDDLSGLAIAGDATVCPNGTVELTASATSTSPGTITYSWDGGAASATSTYTTSVITGDFGSSHNITVEAVAGACSETATHTVKIDKGIRDGAMTINGSAGKELRICGGETIELGTTHTGSNFAWYDMSGSPIQSGATLSVTPTQTTQYELRFENQCATSDTITIEVSSFSVSVDWTALNKTICTGEEAYATLSLTGYDPTASGAYIKWYKDGSELTAFANNSSLTITQATLSDNGTYTYKVSNGACEKPDATTADAGTLTVLAPATYTKSADQVICAGESVLLEVTANETDAQLQWADGLTDASRSENPTQATTYQFTVNRSGYCAVTDSIVVDVRQLPVTKITDNLLVCEGDAAELVGGATGDDLSGYYWIAPSGDTIGSGLKVRITPTEGGEYQFVVNSANCGSSASKLTLTLVERPKVGIDSLGIRDRRILVLSGGSGAFEFRIDEGEWSANDTYTNIPFMQHTAWVRDEVGCQGSALFVVTAPEIAIPEFFSPEGDGVNDEWDLSHIFDVYDQAEVTIYDRFGKELITFNGDVGSWDGTYNGHPMPSTDYWYVINIPEIDMIYTGHFTLIRK